MAGGAFTCVLVLVCVLAVAVAVKTRGRRVGARGGWPPPARIPRIIHRTTHLRPEAVPDLLGAHAVGFDVPPPWTDDECEQFLLEEFGERARAAFRGFTHGAHRADLWRYAILYKRGGIYLDIKSGLYDSLADLVAQTESETRYGWLAVLGNGGGQIFNGILMTPPGNPLIYRALAHIISPEGIADAEADYLSVVRQLYRLCADEYGAQVNEAPITVTTATSQLVLLQERCSSESTAKECTVPGRAGGTALDRYGGCCNAYLGNEARPRALVRAPGYRGGTDPHWGDEPKRGQASQSELYVVQRALRQPS